MRFHYKLITILSIFVLCACNPAPSPKPDEQGKQTATTESTATPFPSVEIEGGETDVETTPSPVPTLNVPTVNLNCTPHLEMQWGSGPGQLGYCPETSEERRGPFPPVLNEQGEWFIFDRVNQRILRYLADSTSQTIPIPSSYVFPDDVCAYSNYGQSNLSVSKNRLFLRFSELKGRIVDRLAVLSLEGEEEHIIDLEPYYPLHSPYLNSLIADRKGGVYLLFSPEIVYYDPNLRPEFISSGPEGIHNNLVVGWDENLYTYSVTRDRLANWGPDNWLFVYGESLNHISDLIASTPITSPDFTQLLGADAQGRIYLKVSEQAGDLYILRASASGDQLALATTTEDWPLPFLVGPDGALYGITYSFRNPDPAVQPTIFRCEFEE